MLSTENRVQVTVDTALMVLRKSMEGIVIKEMREGENWSEFEEGVREVSIDEVALVAGGQPPGLRFCELPTAQDQHFIALVRWAGWSDARIARAFYR